jgi:hypothetical protein
MKKLRQIMLILAAGIALLILVGWLGLQIKPGPFPAFPQQTPLLETVSLPAGLPAPVERFYREIYGEHIPVIKSAVITGRGPLRIMGITLPARFRFIHIAGHGYRHYIEVTFFGLPVMKVNERYLNGHSLFELPFGVLENDPNTNQGANLGLWAESVWLPAILLTDSRVRWEPVDDVTALLVVPFGQAEERFVVRFDPDTDLLRFMEAMRYRDSADKTKNLWIPEVTAWKSINGYMLPEVSPVTWFDMGAPWAVFNVEEVVYNVDVQDHIQQRGP